MYALAFDFDKNTLQVHYGQHVGPSWSNAYKAVKATLEGFGFTWVQGCLYHVDTDDMGVLFMAIQALMAIPWFPPSVRDIRAYRVEQWSDFTPIVKGTARPRGRSGSSAP
jgi:virulence-associated protein VapD